ncbi:serine/arginine repetitive matrix protein 2 isoform X9 [Echinops telfairi]|uniref:Serine/arginine repetitive matrix protein 2 isoform X9 n=1 Tax=Echinops telfairi TaxID=9371 RepID=A0AC55CMA9_ECHTE|nr:serine/arginine repetitive matrix protein 2 isoform X9 [Echinops telfairi]
MPLDMQILGLDVPCPLVDTSVSRLRPDNTSKTAAHPPPDPPDPQQPPSYRGCPLTHGQNLPFCCPTSSRAGPVCLCLPRCTLMPPHIPVPDLGRLDSVLVDGSRSPRKPIDSLRDSRSLSYSPAERRHPSPQPSPRDQQRSSSERASRRAQRGDSRSPSHKRRKETPSPHPVRHRSSRSP